jgi:phosphoribosyl-ATP pyrophosphohydrolase/phosphoribosyl-AMP cyclohydrolase
MSDNNIEFLKTLEQIIESRKVANATESYTAQLFSAGVSRIAQKLGEEGIELALANVQQDRAAIVSEAADLLYHLLVLLRSNDVPLKDVVNELEARHY